MERSYAFLLRLALRSWFAALRGAGAKAERHARRLVWAALQGRAREVSFERDGILWTVPVGRFSVAANCFVEGAHQSREIRAVLTWVARTGRLAHPRGALIDVGANLGSPGIPLARATGLRVVSVEPVPATCAYLRQNVEQNGLAARVSAVNAAISTERGALEMVVHDDPARSEAVTGGVQGFGAARAVGARVRVPAIPLDELVAEQGIAPAEVALVWSDTQGHEQQVIASGKALWAAGAPLFVELWPPGLAAHGGVDAFAATARSHFAGYVLRDDLLARGSDAPVRSMESLPATLAALRDAHTDALFVPSNSATAAANSGTTAGSGTEKAVTFQKPA